VNGRKITVMLNGARSRITNDGVLLDNHPPPSDEQELDPRSSPPNHPPADNNNNNNTNSSPEPRRPEIKFSRTVTKSDGMGEGALKPPISRSEQEHIDILERQRKRDDEVLRIPNPRDADRGILPKRVEAGDGHELEAIPTRAEGPALNTDREPQTTAADSRQQAITIEEPDRHKLQQSDSDSFVDDARAAARALMFFGIPIPKFLRRKAKKPAGDDEELGGATTRVRSRRQSIQTLRSALTRDKVDGTPYLSWEPTIGRNSAFPDLSEEQREELGGIEYRSLKTLAMILAGYFWGYHALGIIGLTPWIQNMPSYGEIVDKAGVSRVWWAFFSSSSAFMDLGFTLTPDSMISFNTATWPLLLLSFLIVIGNTGFPIMLRFVIWVLSHLVPVGTGVYEELRFLLDHPRRCFTLLFPAGATWWLFWLLVIMNGLDVMFFIVLDVSYNPSLRSAMF
jgi:potassium uptake Trk family protein